MGTEFSSLFSKSKKERDIFMAGIHGAGKSMILYKMTLNDKSHSFIINNAPTKAFYSKPLSTESPSKCIEFMLHDMGHMGGKARIRTQLANRRNNGHQKPKGLIFVVDSSDVDSMTEAKQELFNVLESPELKSLPLLVIANMQDVHGALEPEVVADKLGLSQYSAHVWHVRGASAINDEGIDEAMRILYDMVKKRKIKV